MTGKTPAERMISVINQQDELAWIQEEYEDAWLVNLFVNELRYWIR